MNDEQTSRSLTLFMEQVAPRVRVCRRREGGAYAARCIAFSSAAFVPDALLQEPQRPFAAGRRGTAAPARGDPGGRVANGFRKGRPALSSILRSLAAEMTGSIHCPESDRRCTSRPGKALATRSGGAFDQKRAKSVMWDRFTEFSRRPGSYQTGTMNAPEYSSNCLATTIELYLYIASMRRHGRLTIWRHTALIQLLPNQTSIF
jgi:hypothetical protein